MSEIYSSVKEKKIIFKYIFEYKLWLINIIYIYLLNCTQLTNTKIIRLNICLEFKLKTLQLFTNLFIISSTEKKNLYTFEL